MKLTLQQAIFTISNLTKKQKRLLDYIRDNYVVPLKVNGKEVFEQTQADEMLKNLSELGLVNQDIVALKDGINVESNNSKLIDLEVKISNDLDNRGQGIQNAFSLSIQYEYEYVINKKCPIPSKNKPLKKESTRVENGVGVVQYGVLNRNELMEKFNKLENEVNSLSEKIDNVNSKTEIEVKLLSSTD